MLIGNVKRTGELIATGMEVALKKVKFLKKTGTTLAHQLTTYMPRIGIFVLTKKKFTYIIILYVLYMLFEIMSSSSLHKFKTKWISLSFYFF